MKHVVWIFVFSLCLSGAAVHGADTLLAYAGAASKPPTEEAAKLYEQKTTGYRDGRLIVECPALGFTVHLPAAKDPPVTPIRVTVGILAENIALRDKAHPPRPSERLLTGQIRLVDFSGRWLVQFHHNASPLLLELHAAQRTVEAFGLSDGQTGVTVGLPENALFWMPVDE